MNNSKIILDSSTCAGIEARTPVLRLVATANQDHFFACSTCSLPRYQSYRKWPAKGRTTCLPSIRCVRATANFQFPVPLRRHFDRWKKRGFGERFSEAFQLKEVWFQLIPRMNTWMSSERILKAVRRKASKASRIKQGFLKCIKLVTLKIQAQRIHGLLASTSAATPLSGGKESCGSDSTLSSEAHSRSTYAPSQHNPKSRDFFCKIFKISRAWVCLLFKVALNSNKNMLNIEWSWGSSTNLWCLEVSSTIIAFQHRSNSRHLQLKGKMILHSLLLAVTPVKRCGKVPRKKTRRNPGIQTKDRRSVKGACF